MTELARVAELAAGRHRGERYSDELVEAVRAARAAGFTVQRIADVLGVTHGRVSVIVRGAQYPSARPAGWRGSRPRVRVDDPGWRGRGRSATESRAQDAGYASMADLVAATMGERLGDLSERTGISRSTLYHWRRRA